VDFNHINKLVLIAISNKMMPNLNVLGLGMINRILHNTNCTLNANVDRSILEIESIIQELILQPNTCPQQLAAVTYSASVDNVAAIVCFLHCHETNILPRY
jgi:hypothetical protein